MSIQRGGAARTSRNPPDGRDWDPKAIEVTSGIPKRRKNEVV